MCSIHEANPRLGRFARLPGFSLLEMLVAFAVVVILVAILTPVILNLRHQSNSAKCSVNLRQIGVLLNTYATLHNGKLPPVMQSRNSGGTVAYDPWTRYLAKIMPEFSGGRDNEWWRSDTFWCPEEESKFSYGMNWAARGASLAQVEDPARTVMVGDSVVTSGNWCLVLYPVWPADQHAISFRHQGSANMLFFDGHVEAREDLKEYEWDKWKTWQISQ